MWVDLFVRFIVGGLAVSFFALIGDLFKPKSFAGLFGAAPSIAIGSLALAFAEHGGSYAAIEGRSMIAGAVAFFLYSQLVSWLLLRYRLSSTLVSTAILGLWFVTAFAMWALVLRQP